MREIKFRAYAYNPCHELIKEHSKSRWIGKWNMVNVQTINLSTGNIRALYLKGESKVSRDYSKGEYHLMQYTDIKDRHGKEIYEGDIVKYKTLSRPLDEYIDVITEVTYKVYGFTPFIEQTDCEDEYYDYTVEEVEIIGNIHQNKELLV
jgi:uncharacterized phage protein (TIGR01671 family)